MSGTTDWEAVFRERIATEVPVVRPWLLEHASIYPTSGVCFEAAVGLGGNLPFLLGHGYTVYAADLSIEAVRFVKKTYPDVRVVRADLHNYVLPCAKFNLICQFYFLDWALMDQYRLAVAPGGIVVLETLTASMLEQNPNIYPAHLLKAGQLLEYFADWKILDYREGWVKSYHGGDKSIASIVVQK